MPSSPLERTRGIGWRALAMLVLCGWVLVGCLAPTLGPITPTVASAAPATPTLSPASTATPAPIEITILQTSDEHGQLLPAERGTPRSGGVVQVAAHWVRQGHDPRILGNTLLLSSGDNWVGPAISTWFEGQSTIEAMNAMGYQASAVGNHDLDMGPEVLAQRAEQARFPYLAGNLFISGTQELPPWAQPYLVTEIRGLKVGVLGLALITTPQVTAARRVAGLEFGPYDAALRRWAPAARADGAQALVVIAHACQPDLLALASNVQDLGITLFLGGHCHEAQAEQLGAAAVATAGPSWGSYVSARLRVDPTGQVRSTAQVVMVEASEALQRGADPALTALIDPWQARTQAALGEAIGYTARGLDGRDPDLQALLVKSWLWAYPAARIAVSNTGGFRQGLERGEITLGDIVGMLPFENGLYELQVSGRDLMRLSGGESDPLVFAGVERDASGRLRLADGSPLAADVTYRLLTTDYLYENAKYPFQGMDATPYDTGIPWRQPLIDWLKLQRTSRERPLEELLP